MNICQCRICTKNRKWYRVSNVKQRLHCHRPFLSDPLDPRSPTLITTRLVNLGDRPIQRLAKILRALGVLANPATPAYAILIGRPMRIKNVLRSKMRHLLRYPDRDIILVVVHPALNLNDWLVSPLLRSLRVPLVNWQRLRHPVQILSAIPVIPNGR